MSTAKQHRQRSNMACKQAVAKAAGQKRPSRILNTRKKASANSNAASPLLSLPPEIRNRIYGYVLGGHDIHVNDFRGTNINRITVSICTATVQEASAAAAIRHSETSIDIPSWNERHRQCETYLNRYGSILAEDSETHTTPIPYSVPLLETCSQVHREAALIPFQKNNFIFDWYATFSAFAKQLMPIQKRAITTVSLDNLVFRTFHRGQTNPALPGFKGFTGLKNVTVFAEASNIVSGIIVPQNLVYLRDSLSEKLSIFKAVDLSSATICIYLAKFERGHESARTDPAQVNKFCEELEDTLLKKDSTQRAEADEEEP